MMTMTEAEAYRALRALVFEKRVRIWRQADERARMGHRSWLVLSRRFGIWRSMRGGGK